MNNSGSIVCCALLWIGLWGSVCANDNVDVKEGHDAMLKCRFDPSLLTRDPTLYWIRTNEDGKDNVVILDKALEQYYSIRYSPAEGKYDLHIESSKYERDNGKFECKIKEEGTGNDLHTSTSQLTVLIEPGVPYVNQADVQAIEGKPVDLVCTSIGGSPDPQIKWYRRGSQQPLNSNLKSGGNRDNPTIAILTITPKKEDDGEEYRCVVWNRALAAGKKLETTTRLSVDYYPRVKVGPENPLQVVENDTARMTCKVDAKPPVQSVHWTRNGQFVGVNFTHVIPYVSVTDAGVYECIADNVLGQVGKAQLTLDVLYGPRVTVEPTREVDEGDSIRLPCHIESNPPPISMEWIKLDDESFRQRDPSLFIGRVSAKDAGEYMCRAVTRLGTVETVGNASTSILIRHSPGIAQISTDAPVGVEGHTFKMKCDSSPPGFPKSTYRWWKDGSDITIAMNQEYIIPVTRLTDEGQYHCQPSNNLGHGTVATFRLDVYQPPQLVTKLQPRIIRSAGDQDFSIVCSAQGKPKPVIRWFKDGIEIPANSPLYIMTTEESEGKGASFTVQSTLKFQGRDRRDNVLLPTDRGNHTCQYENEVGKIQTNMYLTVEHSPILLHRHNKVAADLNETADITCRMQAYPRPSFEWTFGGSIIGSDSEISNATVALPDDVYQSTLRIEQVTPIAYGEYTCKARNSLGDHKTIIRLQAKGPPESPETPEAVASGPTWVLLHWEEGFNGGYKNTNYTVVASTSLNGVTEKQVSCRNYNKCNITDLKQQTTYFFKVRAINVLGTGPYSGVVEAMTKIDIEDIPTPIHVRYGRSDRTLEFNVAPSQIDFVGVVDIRTDGGGWRTIGETKVVATHGSMTIDTRAGEVEHVRVKLCLKTNTSVCTEPVEATYLTSLPQPATQGALADYIIPLVAVVVLLVVVIGIVSYCCYRRDHKTKKEVERDEHSMRPNMVTQQPPPPYYPHGVDNKAIDRSMSLDEQKANGVYGNTNYYHMGLPSTHAPNGLNIGYMDNSYSNSNNGGSVNSQESLWKGGNPDGVAHDRSYHYDPMDQVFPGYHDYSHYPNHNPNAEDYLNQRNMDYMASGGDSNYSHHNPKRRMEPLDNSYPEISGLPDPYLSHDMDDRSRGGTSYEENPPLDGTYTPNSRSRRVIREIIV